MIERRLSPSILLIFLSAAVFLAFTVGLMLAPLLVELAEEFRISVGMAGQLISAMAFAWSITALVAGPLSDIYGRRLIILIGLTLMAIGTMSSALAFNFILLMACRFLSGIGAAMIPLNCLATVVDIFPPGQRGKALGWVTSALGLGTALGIPAVALLADIGGWRLPFYFFGALLILLLGILWVWFPRSQVLTDSRTTFFAHYREVGSNANFWHALAANCLQVISFMGLFGYLAVYLIRVYRMSAGETALPLTLAGIGVIVGTIIGGRVASHKFRLLLLTSCFILGGLLALFIFTTHISLWITVMTSFLFAIMLTMLWPVMALLLTEMAGSSRATATGIFAMSNQLGTMLGTSIGGLMLHLGSFPLIGLFCFATAITSAIILRFKVRESSEVILSDS
jgi:predicted MFS family arabinose efflux permease